MKSIIIVILICFIASSAAADVLIKLKNGTSFTWTNYTEEDGNACTWKSSGRFCISTNEITSIKEIKDNTPQGANIIVSPPQSNKATSTNDSKVEDPRKAREKQASKNWAAKDDALDYEYSRQCTGVSDAEYKQKCRSLYKELQERKKAGREQFFREYYGR